MGTGQLVTWTVMHGRPAPDGGPARTVAGIVELAEGPWFTARLIGVEGSELTAGTPLRVRFVRPDGGEALPVFEPSPSP